MKSDKGYREYCSRCECVGREPESIFAYYGHVKFYNECRQEWIQLEAESGFMVAFRQLKEKMEKAEFLIAA